MTTVAVRLLVKGALVFLAVAGLVACTRRDTGPGHPARHRPHQLRMIGIGDLDTLNPHFSQFEAVGRLSSLTMAYLTRWDGRNVPSPELATEIPSRANGGVSANGLTVVYRLRRGVRWSDGAPFTAADVAFTASRILDPRVSEANAAGWDAVRSVTMRGPFTVEVRLKRRYPPLVATFFSTEGTGPCILPAHLLRGVADLRHASYNALPVGIGPFVYRRWDRNDRVLLERNPYYWRPPSTIESIVYRIVPDRNSALLLAQEHEADLWLDVPARALPIVRESGGFSISRTPGYGMIRLDFNVGRPTVRERPVRAALRAALDRAALLAKIANGTGALSEAIAPRSAPYAPAPPALERYDLAVAADLLQRAGWRRGTDGVRIKRGVRLALAGIMSQGSPEADRAIEVVRQSFAAIGVELHVRHVATTQFSAPLEEGGALFGGNWDIAIVAYRAGATGDFAPDFGCRAFPPHGANDMRWCDPKADRAMRALSEDDGWEARRRDVAELQRAIVADVPTVVLFQRDDIDVRNAALRNFEPNAVSPLDALAGADI